MYEHLTVAKPLRMDLHEMQRLAMEIDDRFRRVSEKLALLEGQAGRTALHFGPMNLQGNRLTGLPPAEQPTDPVTLADLGGTNRSVVQIIRQGSGSGGGLGGGMSREAIKELVLEELIRIYGSLAEELLFVTAAAELHLEPQQLSCIVVSTGAVPFTLYLPETDDDPVLGKVVRVYRVGAGTVKVLAHSGESVGAAGIGIENTVVGQEGSIVLRVVQEERWNVAGVVGTWRTVT